MPQPKARTRAVSARLANPHSESLETAPELAAKQQPSNKISSDIYGVSDREIRRRETLASTKEAAAADPASSSDAYGVSDREIKRRTSARVASAPSAMRTASASKAREARGPSSDQPQAGSSKSQVRTRQRREPDMSGIDVDDEMFGDMDTSFDDQDLESSPPAIAQSAETSSTFNTGMFHRRRPSSVAGKDDAPIRPSSRGPNTPGLSSTFNLGMFKRRPRVPSILGTAQKDRARRPDPESPGLDQGDGETFPAARSRKRKSDESQDAPSKRQAAESDDDIHDSIEVTSNPATPAPELSRPVTPDMDDSVLAPPASSGSSCGSPTMYPSLKSLAHVRTRRQKTPAPNDNASDMSSPPSLTHSPNYDAPKPAAKRRGRGPARRAPSPVTTAALTSLLPRRRRKVRDDPWAVASDDEVDTSGLGQDEDELAADSRRTRPRKPSQPLATSTTTATQTPKSRGTKGPRRKYGSRNFSDKENNEETEDSIEVAPDSFSPLPDDTFDAPEGYDESTMEISEELKKAAKKFKEVDRWELDFEVVAPRSSSPQDAR